MKRSSYAPTTLEPSSRLILDNIYFKQNIPGTNPLIYTREIVKERLYQALDLLPKEYGFLIYDIFRTLKTQKALFLQFKERFALENPSWDEERLLLETKKFVPYPEEGENAPIMPHNTGGAVDLTLTYNGIACPMGTEFDDSTPMAAPDFFEKQGQNKVIRDNRRMLFNAMTSCGFSVHPFEWWHYNFGNEAWGQKTGKTPLFGSMEKEYSHE